MKNIMYLVLGILFSFTTACGQSPRHESGAAYQRVSTYEVSSGSSNVVMQELRDPQTGRVNIYMPLPADWEVSGNGIEGPDGVTLQEFPGGSFNWQQRQINSIDQIIQQDIQQLIQRNGAQFLRTIDLPDVAQRDERLGSQYWSPNSTRRTFQAKGVEVRDAEGKPVLLVVHHTQTHGPYGVAHNFYYLHALTSTDERYETDKEIVRFALANQQSNPEAVMAFNQKEQQAYIQRQHLFDARMRQAWNHFNAWNKAHVETWNDISESSMASWRRQEAMRDAGQARTVDGILERERVVDPQSGRQLDVDAGYKYYYTNGQGDWIGTNDEFFNPARDPNLNHQEWRKAPLRGNR